MAYIFVCNFRCRGAALEVEELRKLCFSTLRGDIHSLIAIS